MITPQVASQKGHTRETDCRFAIVITSWRSARGNDRGFANSKQLSLR
jgi:hypothetical protein